MILKELVSDSPRHGVQLKTTFLLLLLSLMIVVGGCDDVTNRGLPDGQARIVPSLPLIGERLLWILAAVGVTIWSAFKWKNGTVSLLLGTACCVIGVVRGGLDPIMLLIGLLFGVATLAVYVTVDR